MSTQFDAASYNIRILGAGIGQAKTGTPQVELKAEILSQIEENDDGTTRDVQCQDGMRTIKLYLTEKTAEFTIRKLRDAGWQGQSFDDIQSIIGCLAAATCHHEEATQGDHVGELFEKWDLGIPKGIVIKHDPSTAKKLNALFGKMLKTGTQKPTPQAEPKQAAQRETVPASRQPPAEYGTIDDDDIPF